MRFSVFTPSQAKHEKMPVLFFLAGLTCNEETFMIKAGAQRVAAELGVMLVAPDTSPRNTGIDDATGDWEFGEGAGFYLNATNEKYGQYFNMHDYVADELPALLSENFAADTTRRGISGRRGFEGADQGDMAGRGFVHALVFGRTRACQCTPAPLRGPTCPQDRAASTVVAPSGAGPGALHQIIKMHCSI